MMNRSQVVSAIARVVRANRLSYEEFSAVCREVRREVDMRKAKRSRHLPKIMPEVSLKAFYEAVDKGAVLQHQIMLRLLFYTAVRVSELVSIEVGDVDVAGRKIFISAGKGDKDRYILFPESFGLALASHMASTPENRYLFESRQRRRYSSRRVQQIVKEYAGLAGIDAPVHPHLFRHQMLTWLTAQGLPDAAIQLISGHASKKSLEIYQHVSLEQISGGYQKAVKELEI